MVIISLFTAGVGLAIDAYSERKARREERRGSSDSQVDGEIVKSFEDTEQQRQEQDAFIELQNYADFQSDLSSKVLNDLSRGDIPMARSEPVWSNINHGAQQLGISHGAYRGRLEWPIIVPQDYTQSGHSYWRRAYPRPLMDCGIDQDTFLKLLDSFDVHTKLSARFEAFNIASIASDLGWQNSRESIFRAIPTAVQIMKAYQKDKKSSSFLNYVNALSFQPRGLFAMVMTSRQDSPLQVIHVQATSPVPENNECKMKTSTDDDLSIPLESIFMTKPSEAGSLKQLNEEADDDGMEFDFLHRKRYFEKIHIMDAPRTKLFQLPADRSSPPSVSLDRSPLSNILSSVVKHRERRFESVNKRIRRDRRLPSRSGVPLTIMEIGVPPSSSKRRTQTVQSNEENIGMERDALYLVIVNDHEDDPKQSRKMGFDTSIKAPSHAGISSSFYDPVFSDNSTAPPAYSERRHMA